MAIVVDKNQRWRLAAAYVFLIVLCAVVVFPFLVVLSVSFRPGNFATGSLIPQNISFEHWRYAFGLPYQAPDGRLVYPELPVLRWLFNSIKVAAISAAITLLLSLRIARQAVHQFVDRLLGGRDRGFQSFVGELVVFDRGAVEIGDAETGELADATSADAPRP